MYAEMESTKEELVQECRSLFQVVIEQKEKLMDEKRELDFVIEMLDEQRGRLEDRWIRRLEDMEHKIEVQKLGQQKNKKESK